MVSPSLACADYLHLEHDIRTMDAAGVQFYHIDIMDGHYVPNLCLNFDMVQQIRTISKTPMDVHLMVTNPMDYIERMATIGIEYAATHIDNCDAGAFLDALHKKGIKAGLAVSPEDTVEDLAPYLAAVDYLILMFVKPGFAGQQFQPAILKKLQALYTLREEKDYSYLLFADGGIGWHNVADVVQAGADVQVGGVFSVFDPSMDIGDASRRFIPLTRSLREQGM